MTKDIWDEWKRLKDDRCRTEQQKAGDIYWRGIIFMKPLIAYCDGNCQKAWGVCNRPDHQLDPGEPDDVLFLRDDELGDAPADPGTYEGGDGKPFPGHYLCGKWCFRECERCHFAEPYEDVVLTDEKRFRKRHFNMPYRHKDEDPEAITW